MAPTIGHKVIEGRYKEYAYSPVPASSTSAEYDSTTPGQYTDSGAASLNYYTYSALEKSRVERMSEKGSTVLQYVAAAAANMATVSTGALLGWTSPALARMKEPKFLDDNPLGRLMTDDENTWIGSLVAIGAVVGSFIAGYLAERWGRKWTLLSSLVPFLLGWVLIGTTKVVFQLYVARVILGIALSFTFTVVPMYCGEIAETSVRGALGSFLQLFITFGLLYAYCIGPYVNYLVFWLLCAILPIVFFGCFFFMPESPYYLLKVGKREDAINSLAKLRGKTAAGVLKEADEMQAAIDEAFKNEAKLSDLFTIKANFKALIFTALLASFQQLSGINVVLFYMEGIFKAAKSSLSPSVATIIVGSVQTMASAVTPVVVDRLGRKMLLIFSGIGEIVTLITLGVYMYMQDKLHEDMSSVSIIPILALVIFIATYCVGWGPLPWTVMGEMFAPTVKSKASGITVCVCWGISFFITKFSSALQDVFGSYTLYWVFAVFCVLSVLFTVFVLPETKGKNLQEIQDELSGNSPSIPELTGASKK